MLMIFLRINLPWILITKLKRFIGLPVNFFESLNIRQSYQQERDYVVHCVACNFAKYSPIINTSSLADSAINLFKFGY